MMELRDITMDDLALYVGMLTDERVMAELGGPLPPDGLEEKLRGIVRQVESGEIWYSVIAEDDQPAGTVCIWNHDDRGENLNEIGWMVVPQFQGRGLATAAVRAYLERAKAENRWGVVRAFPGKSNAASNAICRKTGFTLIGEREVEYMGRWGLSNDWKIDLAS